MKKKSNNFSDKVRKLACLIPFGRVTTYGILVQAAGGHPMLSRMVTHILSSNVNPDIFPYHRIVYSDGRVWLPPGSEDKRLELYRQEGILLDAKNRIINFNQLVYYFDL